MHINAIKRDIFRRAQPPILRIDAIRDFRTTLVFKLILQSAVRLSSEVELNGEHVAFSELPRLQINRAFVILMHEPRLRRHSQRIAFVHTVRKVAQQRLDPVYLGGLHNANQHGTVILGVILAVIDPQSPALDAVLCAVFLVDHLAAKAIVAVCCVIAHSLDTLSIVRDAHVISDELAVLLPSIIEQTPVDHELDDIHW